MLPILFTTSWLTLFSYPLLMGMAWGLGYNLCNSAVNKYKLQKNNFKLFFAVIFFSSWLGSKLLFLIASASSEFENYAFNSNFWLGGGFVFLGGVLGGLLSLTIFSIILKKYPLRDTVYFLAPLCFGHALGRVGCFLAGCCYGTHCDLPWKINLHGDFRHPVQLYEAILVFLLGLILYRVMKKENPQKMLMNIYFGGYSVIRFLLEFLRGDKIRGSYESLSTSQILTIFFVTILIIINLYIVKKKRII